MQISQTRPLPLSTPLLRTRRQWESALTSWGRDTCYHGNAGIASAFAALADHKLKPGGVFALVLPLSAATGLSWRGFREMLGTSYTDLTVLSMATASSDELSFSADTGMAECLVIARKLGVGEMADARQLFTSVKRRPQGLAHSSLMTQKMSEADHIRQIEDGPYGGTSILIGNDLVGEMLTASHSSPSDAWGGVRISDFSLAQTAYALERSKLWLPRSPEAVALKLVEPGFNRQARGGPP